MIKIENVEVAGWEHAIRGMRNPMNSWDKSDTKWVDYKSNIDAFIDMDVDNMSIKVVGENDFDLMKKLTKAGTDHRKFMRMIVMYVDVTAPLYWWKEFDTYKVGTVRNSCSTMHKITDKEFTLDDFSYEYMSYDMVDVLNKIIEALNIRRDDFLETKQKTFWWDIIQILPSSYNQRSTVMLNYEVLRNIYHARKNHKLDEWRAFCKWIESLPYSELITGGDEK